MEPTNIRSILYIMGIILNFILLWCMYIKWRTKRENNNYDSDYITQSCSILSASEKQIRDERLAELGRFVNLGVTVSEATDAMVVLVEKGKVGF